jgi:hypothetical protein
MKEFITIKVFNNFPLGVGRDITLTVKGIVEKKE